MAIIAAASMSSTNDNKDEEELMPGFRFHPTEEELVEFYLRRKVEGRSFNVELITFLDLYRYDPWELPGMAAIGEKEWYFYVPRDRKYRNGDRPNRVTTSGYWKATGADRMIRTANNSRSIGLKKTLVFYSGKAPKGIRTSWIMNEYRLPQQETQRYQKAEISLCRVYKRPGVDGLPSLPRSLATSRASSSRSLSDKILYQDATPHHHQFGTELRFQAFGRQSSHQQMNMAVEKLSANTYQQTDGSGSCSDVTTVLGLSKKNVNRSRLASITTSLKEEQAPASPNLFPNCTNTIFPIALSSSSFSSSIPANAADEFQRLLTYHQASVNLQQPFYNDIHHQQQQSQLQPLALNMVPSPLPTAFYDRLWEWNPIPEANREFNNDPFK